MSIVINKTSTNTCIFTLTEKCTISTHDFLFKFTNNTTGDSKIFSATDISPAVDRYNEFVITESGTENLYNGTVFLSPVGQWHYEVFEMTQASPPSLDPSIALATVETGRLLVIGSDNTPPIFTAGETKDTPVFE